MIWLEEPPTETALIEGGLPVKWNAFFASLRGLVGQWGRKKNGGRVVHYAGSVAHVNWLKESGAEEVVDLTGFQDTALVMMQKSGISISYIVVEGGSCTIPAVGADHIITGTLIKEYS